MSHPLIGITSSLTADGQQILDRRYIEAVERAGGAAGVADDEWAGGA